MDFCKRKLVSWLLESELSLSSRLLSTVPWPDAFAAAVLTDPAIKWPGDAPRGTLWSVMSLERRRGAKVKQCLMDLLMQEILSTVSAI